MENKNIKFNFVRNGTTAEETPAENTIWIDVGNKMQKGIIDHHGDERDDSVCAAEMVYKHPELVLENITDSRDLTIVGHISPDFDCVASAYLVKQLAEKGKIDPEMEKIVEYAKLTDTGRINPERNNIRNVYSILNAFAYMPENANKSNEFIMKKGFELLDYCIERIKNNPKLTLESEDLLGDDCPYTEELKLLEEASKQYEKVLEEAEKTEMYLPTLDGGVKKVPDVFIKSIPENKLTRDMLKNWLRNDGFVFTSIPIYDSHRFITDDGRELEDVPTSRVVLSVAPGNNVYLKGLGYNIEKKEEQKCSELGIRRYSGSNGNITYSNRPGYESPDPWYDGRGHNYEIIDGPMSGSVLSVDEINNIAKEYSIHIQKANKLVETVEESRKLDESEKNQKNNNIQEQM